MLCARLARAVLPHAEAAQEDLGGTSQGSEEDGIIGAILLGRLADVQYCKDCSTGGIASIERMPVEQQIL